MSRETLQTTLALYLRDLQDYAQRVLPLYEQAKK